ncbi:MAG: hypothetical protein ABJH52_17130 [Henriciella sp.]
MSDGPIKKFKLGKIVASVWENKNENGDSRYSVTIVRSYKKGDEWKETSTFFPEDLPVVARLSERALSHVMLKQEGFE